MLAVLTRNTAFDVTVVKDETWAYGRAGTLSGWVLRQWLKRTCP